MEIGIWLVHKRTIGIEGQRTMRRSGHHCSCHRIVVTVLVVEQHARSGHGERVVFVDRILIGARRQAVIHRLHSDGHESQSG